MKLYHPNFGILPCAVISGRLHWDTAGREVREWWPVPERYLKGLTIIEATEAERQALGSLGLFPARWNPAEIGRSDQEKESFDKPTTQTRRGEHSHVHGNESGITEHGDELPDR